MASDLSSPNYAAAISSIESGGAADPYTTMGPVTKSGDQAYGKFQIMGQNIGPWSKEILGREVTPQEFLANPQIQDAIFQGKFQQYVDRFGPEGAAQAWFAGPGGVGKLDRKDVLGTSVGAYGQRFMKALGAPQPPDALPVTQASPPVPVLSSPLPAYGFTPNNAPAGISGAQPSPQQAQPGFEAPQQGQQEQSAGLPHMAPPIGAPRRPPDLTQLKAAMLPRNLVHAGFRFSRG